MVPGGPCPGRCNSTYRQAREAFEKALAEYDPLDPAQERPLPPDIQPWPGDPLWCGRCAATIRAQLSRLDYAGCVMAAEADGLRGESGEQKVNGSKEEPSPSPAGDDLDDLFAMLAGWEDSYRSLRGWDSAPQRGYLASAITEVSCWLQQHLAGILEHPDIGEPFGHEVMLWHQEIVAKGKEGVRKLRKPLRCPSCHLLMLTWTEGEKYVQCAAPDCGRMLSLAEYEAEVQLRAGAASVTEAAESEPSAPAA